MLLLDELGRFEHPFQPDENCYPHYKLEYKNY